MLGTVKSTYISGGAVWAAILNHFSKKLDGMGLELWVWTNFNYLF